MQYVLYVVIIRLYIFFLKHKSFITLQKICWQSLLHTLIAQTIRFNCLAKRSASLFLSQEIHWKVIKWKDSAKPKMSATIPYIYVFMVTNDSALTSWKESDSHLTLRIFKSLHFWSAVLNVKLSAIRGNPTNSVVTANFILSLPEPTVYILIMQVTRIHSCICSRVASLEMVALMDSLCLFARAPCTGWYSIPGLP